MLIGQEILITRLTAALTVVLAAKVYINIHIVKLWTADAPHKRIIIDKVKHFESAA